MNWIQLRPICTACGEENILFQVFFNTDGVLGIFAKCKCGADLERHIKWEDEQLFAINEAEKERKEKAKTARGRQELKKQKKPKGNA